MRICIVLFSFCVELSDQLHSAGTEHWTELRQLYAIAFQKYSLVVKLEFQTSQSLRGGGEGEKKKEGYAGHSAQPLPWIGKQMPLPLRPPPDRSDWLADSLFGLRKILNAVPLIGLQGGSRGRHNHSDNKCKRF